MDDTGMDEEKPSPQIPVSQLKISDEITTKHSYYEISTVNLKIEQKGEVAFENETSEAHFVDEKLEREEQLQKFEFCDISFENSSSLIKHTE